MEYIPDSECLRRSRHPVLSSAVTMPVPSQSQVATVASLAGSGKSSQEITSPLLLYLSTLPDLGSMFWGGVQGAVVSTTPWHSTGFRIESAKLLQLASALGVCPSMADTKLSRFNVCWLPSASTLPALMLACSSKTQSRFDFVCFGPVQGVLTEHH